MNAIVEFPALANANTLRQIDVEFDPSSATMYWWMRPNPRPCFNSAFLHESADFERRIEQHQGWFTHSGQQHRIENAVFGSKIPGVYNLGGDLSMFIQAILRKDRALLTVYGELCVNNMYRRMIGYDAGIVTYSLIQGKAFGGGLECALASDYIVAEKQSTFSFPEVLFNMFPGMGALSLLARRCGMRRAEDIIMSGEVFSARAMSEFGVIDEVVEDELGLQAVSQMIKSRQRRHSAYKAFIQAKRQVQAISREEMLAVVHTWVDAALRLENRDLRLMARLVRAQDRLVGSAAGVGDEELFESDMAATA
jgi:DSF synthase